MDITKLSADERKTLMQELADAGLKECEEKIVALLDEHGAEIIVTPRIIDAEASLQISIDLQIRLKTSGDNQELSDRERTMNQLKLEECGDALKGLLESLQVHLLPTIAHTINDNGSVTVTGGYRFRHA